MNYDGIAKICEILGLNCGEIRDGNDEIGPQTSISCPLRSINHQDPEDPNSSCSVKIVEDGPSLIRCFSGNCSFKGTLLRALQLALAGDQRPEIAKLLEDTAKIENLTLEAKVERNRKAIEKEVKKQTLGFVEDQDVLSEDIWKPFTGLMPGYSLKRGITKETFVKWGLGYDSRGKRLVFPVRRRDGKLIGMQGRDVTGEAELRHFNYEGIKKDKYVLGAHLLEEGKPIVIVEGTVGAVKTYQALYPEATTVAPMGEGFSKHHADTLCSANPPFICIFMDGDAAGRSMASRIEYGLHGRVPLKVMECPTEIDVFGKKVWDPGNLPAEEIRRIFKDAKLILDRIRWSFPLGHPSSIKLEDDTQK